MTTHILVIGGGQNAEHNVSLATAASIGKALSSRGYTVIALTIDLDGRWSKDGEPLGETVAASVASALRFFDQAEVVFPAVHGPLGEDGTLAALCALTGVPVVGSGLRAGALGMDKWSTKLVAQSLGIATAQGQLVSAAERDRVRFEGEVVVKPASSGSSYGVSAASTPEELREALETAAQFDERIIVEHMVRGREIDVAVLQEPGGELFTPPALEIHAQGLFDTATKYDGTATFSVPAALTPAEAQSLGDAAKALYRELGCAGVARMDFFLATRGPVLIEVNTMPGMTAHSQVPQMFAAAGIDYADLVQSMVRAALRP